MTEEDVLPAIAAEHDMVYSAWKMDAGFACHGKKLHLIYPKVKPDPTHRLCCPVLVPLIVSSERICPFREPEVYLDVTGGYPHPKNEKSS